MPTKCVLLPPNLVQDKKYAGQSIYRRDFCHRHRRTRRAATAPAQSYTSDKKLIGDMHKMQLSDHFVPYPAALSMGYTKNNFEQPRESPEELKCLNLQAVHPEVTPTDQQDTEVNFLENAPASLKKIEQAWLDEVDTGKRERGNLYGLAGKKMNLCPRMGNGKMAHKKSKSLPGLDTWLSTANEYEKQVVHKFISKMSDAYHKPEEPRPQSSPAEMYISGNNTLARPKTEKNVRINSRLISPTIDELTVTKPLRTSFDNKVPSPPVTPPRCNESAQSARSTSGGSVDGNEASAQRLPVKGKPSSLMSDIQRPLSVPASLGHTCQKCDACKKKMLKRLIDELSGNELTSYEDLLKDKSRNLKTISSQMFQDDEEYLHHGCTFQNVHPRPKGYFTIHPEFVSENIVDLKKLRKKHEKYFGESKRPLL